MLWPFLFFDLGPEKRAWEDYRSARYVPAAPGQDASPRGPPRNWIRRPQDCEAGDRSSPNSRSDDGLET